MFQVKELPPVPGFVYACSTKTEGNLSFRYGKSDEVVAGRESLLRQLKVPLENCVVLSALHRDDVIVVDPTFKGRGTLALADAVPADGLITARPGVYLFLLVADCLPLVLVDVENHLSALLHVGWTGADLNTAGWALSIMEESFGSSREDIWAILGPAARKESYLKENPSQLGDKRWEDYLHHIGRGRYQVDFVGLCKQQLRRAGVAAEHIYDCQIDTVKDERFYSHLREKENPQVVPGRFACVVGFRY